MEKKISVVKENRLYFFFLIKVIDTYLEVLRSICVSLPSLAEVEHTLKTLGAHNISQYGETSADPRLM